VTPAKVTVELLQAKEPRALAQLKDQLSFGSPTPIAEAVNEQIRGTTIGKEKQGERD